MEGIPYELLFEMLLQLPIRSVLNFCATSPLVAQICNDDYFWQRRFKQGFRKLNELVPADITGVNNYKELYRYFYDAGIGHHICLYPNLNDQFIYLIKPDPSYDIFDIVNVGLTEIGGTHYYNIIPDLKIIRRGNFGNFWGVFHYPRGLSLDQRTAILRGTPLAIFNNKEELDQGINSLKKQGYYILCERTISDSRFRFLEKKGSIGKVIEITDIEKY